MIQFNLLPDVKIEYIKARRTKRLVVMTATLVGAGALAILIVLFVAVNVFQKRHLANLSSDIERDSTALRETTDINKILTIQSQLGSLPELHNQKPVGSRLYDYIKLVTPANISIAELEVNFAETTISVTGAADSLEGVNSFVDTMKFTTFTKDDVKSPAFSEVVLATFGRDVRGASYNIELKFDPAIFDFSSKPKFTVPKITTTRSDALFQPLSNPDDQPGAEAEIQ